MLTMKNLEACFNTAKQEQYKYIGVKIKMYGFEECEVIINPENNFDKKLAYYKNSYTDDLKLKSAPDKIEIVGFANGDDYNEIEIFLNS